MNNKALDKFIEKYLDEPNNKELKEIFCNTSELFQDVVIKMKRPIKSDRERKLIEQEKEKIYKKMQSKGMIKNEKSRTSKVVEPWFNREKTVEQRTNNEKNLIDEYERSQNILEALYDRLELLEEKQSETNSIKAVDYSKDKVSNSNKFDINTNLIDEIELTKKAIKTQRDELKKQRKNIMQLLEQFAPLESQVIKLNLFHDLTINEIAKQLNKSVGWCYQIRNKIRKELKKWT